MAGKKSLLGDRLFLKSAIVNMTQYPMKGTNFVHKTLKARAQHFFSEVLVYYRNREKSLPGHQHFTTYDRIKIIFSCFFSSSSSHLS